MTLMPNVGPVWVSFNWGESHSELTTHFYTPGLDQNGLEVHDHLCISRLIFQRQTKPCAFAHDIIWEIHDGFCCNSPRLVKILTVTTLIHRINISVINSEQNTMYAGSFRSPLGHQIGKIENDQGVM